MRISLTVTNFSWPGGPTAIGPRLVELAQVADEAGFDTLWVSDHLLQADPTSIPEEAMLEAYTTLGFLAGATTRVRLGTMVTSASVRAPALLVKSVTTLDVLSGGRAWLGIGAGYHEEEAAWMGLPFFPTPERFERLEDTLRLALQMWSGDETPFEGNHHRLTRPIGSPRPVTAPHPPILIGGMGERRTLPLVARYADACNLFDIPDGRRTVARKLDILRRECMAIGRPIDQIDKTITTRLAPDESPHDFAQRCRAFEPMGFDHVVVIVTGPWNNELLTTIATAATDLGPTPPPVT